MNKKLRAIAVIYLFLLAVGTHYFSPLLSAEQQVGSQSPLTVVCSPDKLIVYPKETITLKAWATSSKDKPLKYLWTVEVGTLKGEGSEVTWDFTGVKPGTYNAKVQVTDQKTGSCDCTLNVIVTLPPLDLKGGGYETGRSILLPDQVEAEGYGLYSYVLLGSEPNDSTHERYLNTVIEYLKFPDINRLEKYIKDRKKLNITYLPLETQLEQKMLCKLEDKKYKPVAEWVLKHYDYARARALLRTLPGNHQAGPYIISFLQPLGKNPLSPPYLYQNQSTVPPDLVKLWMKYFLYQAAQERFWEEKTGKKLALKLHTFIGILAVGLPEVQKSLEDLISWKEKIISTKIDESTI